MQTLADWVYGYVTQKRALTLIPGYHPRYPDTQVPPLSITEVERVESRSDVFTGPTLRFTVRGDNGMAASAPPVLATCGASRRPATIKPRCVASPTRVRSGGRGRTAIFSRTSAHFSIVLACDHP